MCEPLLEDALGHSVRKRKKILAIPDFCRCSSAAKSGCAQLAKRCLNSCWVMWDNVPALGHSFRPDLSHLDKLLMKFQPKDFLLFVSSSSFPSPHKCSSPDKFNEQPSLVWGVVYKNNCVYLKKEWKKIHLLLSITIL